MTKSIPLDVTDALRAKGCDINPEDRVYAFGGLHVKVRTLHDLSASGHGHEVFRVSGSIVDAKAGKALVRRSGHPAVHDSRHHATIQNETPVDLVTEIERLRFRCVEQTVAAHRHYNASKGLTGVGTIGARTPEAPARMVRKGLR